jgi:hypothetical protein
MKNVYEIFQEFENAATKNDKVEVLRRNGNYALRSVLQGTFDPKIEFVVERVPYYKPSDSPPGLGYTSIHQELSRIYLFIKNHPKAPAGLTDQRREQLLIQMLEAMEKKEAEVFMNMIMKKQKVKGLNSSIVKEAFPDLLP